MARPLSYIADSGSAQESSPLMDWREILAIIVERVWIGILVATSVMLLFWYDTSRQVPYFRSTATLIVEAQVPQFFNFQDIMSFNTRNLEYFNTHIKAMHSRPIVAAAIEKGNLDDRREFTPGVKPGPGQTEAAMRFLNIAPVERTRMLNIVVEHPDPAIAADFANAVAHAYIQQDLDNRMSASMQAVEWLRARAEEYRVSLERGLLELQKYRESTQSVSLEEDQNIVIAKLTALNNSLTEAQTGRIQLETRWNAVKEQLDKGVPAIEAAMLVDDSTVRDAQRPLRDQQRKMESIQQRYRPGHPDYMLAVEELRNAEAQFHRVCEQAIQALRSAYELAVERERNLEKALREQEQEAFELDRKLVRYDELRRNVEADQKIYQAVIDRMKEALMSGTLPADLIRLVEEARPARTPFRPNRRQSMMRGATMGIVLGFVSIFILYYADHRFRRNEEIERKLGLRALGALPLVTEKSVRDRGLIMHLQDTGEAAESFRTLRASLLMDDAVRSGKCLMITSAHAGEGKSLVATNLAISMAQDHQRTLLIGADLRRPSLQKLFSSESHAGLADVLKGEAMWTDVLIREPVPGLDVLPSGRAPSRPAELLGSRRWPELLKEASGHYDRILLDAPPILGVSDALILLGHTDAVLFVVRYGVTHSLGARHAVNRIKDSGAPCAGVIMNGVNLRSIANYYYYRRYGGYTYGGYAAKDEPRIPVESK